MADTVGSSHVAIDLDLDQVAELDRENLIRTIGAKAAAGKPLTKNEREFLDRQRIQSNEIAGSASVLELKADGVVPALEQMTRKQQAEAWGYSVRQVKNWVADGKRANDPAPICQPSLMCSWFRRVYAPRDAPEKLRLAVARLLEGVAAEETKCSAPARSLSRIEVSDDDKGFLAMLERVRTTEAEFYAKYERAVEDGDANMANFYMAEWVKVSERARALEKVAPETLEKLGIYLRREDVERELQSIHASILKAFRQAFRLHRVRLKSAETSDSWGEKVDEIVDEVSTMLADTEFAEQLELDAA